MRPRVQRPPNMPALARCQHTPAAAPVAIKFNPGNDLLLSTAYTSVMTSTISIAVDADAAQAFSQAPADERRKLELLLSLRLRELTSVPSRPLEDVLNDLGAQAESRGLTPEILDSLLRDE